MAAGQAAKRLVIVESPAKAKTINKYLGADFVVRASYGHVRDLPPKTFGIDVQNRFEPTYEIVTGRKKNFEELRRLASVAPEVYLATDLDREGEAIAWHLVEALNLPEEKIRRVVFNAITRSAIEEAFEQPHGLDMQRVQAQQARRILDRIVGYELSPLLWQKIAKGLSAGRVQSVAVRLIVEREREIRAFEPVESWKVQTCLAPDAQQVPALRSDWAAFQANGDHSQKEVQDWLNQRGALRAELVRVDGNNAGLTDVAGARGIVEALGYQVERVDTQAWEAYAHLHLQQTRLVGGLPADHVGTLTVADVSTRRTTTKAPAPFTTATLQQQASTALRFSASRTMRVAQSLYEGLDLGEGPVGLITYMRTDATYVAPEAVQAARAYVHEHFGPDELPDEPNTFAKRQKRAQEAHEAVRPTDPFRTPEELKGLLTPEQHKLYELIWKRFVGCQMKPAQWDSTAITFAADTPAGRQEYQTNGRKLVSPGYLRVAGVTSEDQLLPALERGQTVGLVNVQATQHYTSPPARYTEAALVKTMEAEGIGRPSTYATIVDTIQSRGYVELDERKFRPTALGELVTDKLVKHFPMIMDVKFTSYMEDSLDKIEEAGQDWVRVLEDFYSPFHELLTQATDAMQMVRSQPSEFRCSACDKPMVYRWSKTGRFLACTGYPRCRETRNVDRDGQPIEPRVTDHACENCGKPLVLRQSRTGHFLGCSGYPQCRAAVPCNADGEPLRLVTEEELQRPCEQCGDGTLVVKRKGRRAFLGCDQYPTCKFTTNMPEDVRLEQKPAPPPEPAELGCEKCGRAMLIRDGKRGKFVACSGFPRCRHTLPFEKLEAAKAEAAANGQTPPPLEGDPTVKGWQTGDPLPDGFALTRTGRLVIEVLPPESSLPCPQCGGTIEMKRGRFGPFFSCTAFPKCRFNCNLRGQAKKDAEVLMPAPVKPKPIRTDIPCLECGKVMLIREGRRGRFLGCSGYPQCRTTRELPAELEHVTAESLASQPAGSER
jgi:DNA topoisomerase-1